VSARRASPLEYPRSQSNASFAELQLRSLYDGAQRFFRKWLEHEDSAARKECRNNFEGRVLGRSADERQFPAFHIRQQKILLALIEAVDLIQEQHLRLYSETR
jgi:hypothetical protein